MKIALLLSGHFRTFDVCYESLKFSILEDLNPDIYISTWLDNDLSFHSENLINGFSIENLPLTVKKYVIEDYSTYDNKFRTNGSKYIRLGNTTKPYRVLSMWYRRLCLLNLIKEEEYDVIIYSRPDIYYTKKLDLSKIKLDSLNLPVSETTIFHKIPDTFTNLPECVKIENKIDGYLMGNPSDGAGYLDTTAIGNMEVMKKYLSLYNHIDAMYDSGCVFHPETLLKYYVTKNNIDVNRFDYSTYILRKWNSL